MSSLKGKKIELLPVKITDEKTQGHCPDCDGIGWIQREEGYIESCRNCNGRGIIKFCLRCGKTTNYYNSVCDECWREHWNETEKEKMKKRLETAQKLFWSRDEEKIKKFNCFYSENYPNNDGYFYDFEDFLDVVDNTNLKFVWGTLEQQIEIDTDNIIENACEDLHEDARSGISDKDYIELKNFVEQWCNKQTGTITFYPDYNYAIEIPWEEKE